MQERGAMRILAIVVAALALAGCETTKGIPVEIDAGCKALRAPVGRDLRWDVKDTPDTINRVRRARAAYWAACSTKSRETS